MALTIQSARLSERGEVGRNNKVNSLLEKIVEGYNFALNANIRMMSTKMELSDTD